MVLGDRAGLFGRGTSGEGCDATDLRLPGRQEELLEALLATGTPVVLVLLVGRPYDISRQADRLAAVVCGFYAGEEGGHALADVLTGRVNPSGRLPVHFPSASESQPSTYLAAPLGQRSEVSTVDPTALFPFGHGLSYAPATWLDVARLSAERWPTDDAIEIAVTLRNDTGIADIRGRAGLPARSGRRGRAAGAAADRRRAGRSRAGGDPHGRRSRCTRT